MSAFSLLSIGASAMAANYTALQTTGNNIANANVAGYSRQRVELTTASSQSTRSGNLGQGVDVKSVSRAHDQFLAREAASAQSNAHMDKARASALQRLEEAFRPGETGVGYAAGQFLNAMTELASRPTDLAVRQTVLARADEVATRFTAASRHMDAIQADVSAALGEGVQRINVLAEGLAHINQKIVSVSGPQGAPNDMLDERDRLLNQLSEKLLIKTVMSQDGSVSVFVGDGRPLVMGSEARPLVAVKDPSDAGRSSLAMKDGAGTRLIDSDFLAGGELAGLLKFQNEDLVQARALLGQMAAGLTAAVNTQHALGTDLKGQPGGDLFFDFHDPAAPGSLALVRPAAGNKDSAVPGLTIADPAKLQAAEYTLAYDTVADGWMLQSSQGGAKLSVADAITVGLNLTGVDALNKGDRFLLQPVTYAAGAMRRQLSRPEDLAAASSSSSNGNVLALAALADQSLVGRSPGGQGGATITDAYASAMAEMGTRVQGATTAADISTSVADQAEVRRSASDGVNLDEEAARLIQSQQAYQASAKVLQVAQSIFDTLLQAAAV